MLEPVTDEAAYAHAADLLAHSSLTGGLTDAQRAELVAAGELLAYTPDTPLFTEGEPAEYLWIHLEGGVELSRRTGTESTVLGTMTTLGQWAGGLQAWSGDRTAGYLTTGRTVADGTVLRVPSEELGRMVREWSPFAKHFVDGIYQSVRNIEALARQRESLVALGTLAAGLAHEINNPAAASLRAVEALRETCESMLVALTELAAATITADQFAALDALRREAVDAVAPDGGPLAASQREDAIGAWLSDHGVERAWHLAPVLAAAGVDEAWCERVEAAVGPAALHAGVAWVVSALDARTLLDALGDTTSRISQLVATVRSYTQMDRASLQRTDVHEGLESTLVMLGQKLEGVTVERDFADDLPLVESYAGELNQVWTNLVDNAIDAMDGAGTIRITTRVDGPNLVVDIADTGPGMPPEVIARAFDPFFTTKDVGKGTGLGLDISRRIVVERHNGEITFDSSAEGTTAHVRIPLDR